METIVKGVSFQGTYRSYANEDTLEAQQPDNLAGWSVRAALHRNCQPDIDLPIRIVPEDQGRIDLTLDQAFTAALPTVADPRNPAYITAVLTDPSGRDYVLQPREPVLVLPL